MTTASQESLQAWLVERIAIQLQRPPSTVRHDVSFADYGLDSVSAITLCSEVEEQFGVVIEPEDMWDHPTIEALGAALLKRLGGTA
jgi:acyl carrier protein